MHFKCVLLSCLKTTDVYYKSLIHRTIKVRFYAVDRNPYHVLGLKNTCSIQDVKKAYIKLCKELHPDMKPGDASQHKKFVELNDAYTSLINSKSRRREDYKYSSSADNLKEDFYWKQHKKATGPFEHGSWQRDEEWYKREEYKQQVQQQSSARPNNIKKGLPLTICFLLVLVGSLLYISAYRYAIYYKTNVIDDRSRKISEDYQDSRKNALLIGKEEQLEKLKKRWSL